MNFELIISYFPFLTAVQQQQIRLLGELYPEWNAKINVISRQDIDNLYERHILHSLGIAKVITFRPGTRIMDAGTGGGFPGIPLAILFPESEFHLVDSTAKKLIVVREIAQAAGLQNVTTGHTRLEDHNGNYDFVVSRAVATLRQMVDWTFKNVRLDGFNELHNGILYLKGGDLTQEMEGLRAWRLGSTDVIGKGGNGNNLTIEQLNNGAVMRTNGKSINHHIYDLRTFFPESFFETKKIVHLF